MSLRPTTKERTQINQQRADAAAAMHAASRRQARKLAIPGPCSPDLNRMPSGELAAVHHIRRIANVGLTATNSLVVARFVGEKPRTTVGPTGIIHEPGGVEAYVEGARQLHAAGVPLASEVMSETASAIVVPHLTLGWIGAREAGATGPRYAVRPTEQDANDGMHPLPVLVKNDQSGGLVNTLNAMRTIMSDKPQTRARITQDGVGQVTTLGNPHVGVILRGQDHRPSGGAVDILAAEIDETRQILDAEFGKDEVPIIIDISHAHAKYEGGGEEGQLRIASAIGDLITMGVPIDGWMAETYILPGKQSSDGTVPGLSITDPCIGQANAEQLLLELDQRWQTAQQTAYVQ